METIKIDAKFWYALAGLVLVCAVGASANSFEKTSQNLVAPNIITFTEDEFQEMRQQEAEGVFNIIKNMEAGYVSSSRAHDDIFDIKFYAEQYTSAYPVEAEVNRAYVDFLNSALDCTNAYPNGVNSELYQKYYGEMMTKKELI